MPAKRGRQPLVCSAPTKEKVAFYGFVYPTTGELFTKECNKFNFETFIDAVKEYVNCNPSDKTRIVVIDNASWHKKGVRLLREENLFDLKVQFLFLPPYSPDFNPIERVWRITRRRRTHNRYFDNLKSLKDTLFSFFHSLYLPNEMLRSLCK